MNSTISGNVDNNNERDVAAGGIINGGTGQAWLNNVTITNNAYIYPHGSTTAGGIYSPDQESDGGFYFYFWNTIIAKNGQGIYDDKTPRNIKYIGDDSDCGGAVFSLGGNLVGSDYKCKINRLHTWDPSGVPVAMDVKNTDPGFEEETLWGLGFGLPYKKPLLRDHGGNTCTVALEPGSPAHNNAWTGAPGAHVLACETYDQRWDKRGRWIQRGGANVFACDIGAYEYGHSPALIGVGCPDH